MDLDILLTSKNRFSKKKNVKSERASAEKKKCFKYSKIDHFARDCRNRNKIAKENILIAINLHFNVTIVYFIEDLLTDGYF